ncbi:MAG: hypothetical protein WBY12_09800, partial [Hyphomicrobium sp.]
GPGPVLQSIHQTDADFAAEVQSTLLKRGPSTAEIAAAVRFILEAPAMTGQMIALDGGQHLTWSESDKESLTALGDSAGAEPAAMSEERPPRVGDSRHISSAACPN